MPTYYTPSGKTGSLSYLYLLAVCLIAMPIVGLIYAYAIWYMPFIYINFLFAAGFGFVIGFLINLVVVKYGKVRSKKMALIFGLFGAIFGLYFHWVSWVDLVINAGNQLGNEDLGITVSNVDTSHLIGLATNPGLLFSLIGGINEIGTWGIGDISINGTFLSVIWVVELLIVVIVALVIGMSAVSEPFCEVTGQWFDKQKINPLGIITDPQHFITVLDENNMDEVKNLSPVNNPSAENHSIFTLYSSGQGERYMSVTNKIAKSGDDGKITFDDTNIISNLSIGKETFDLLVAKS